MNTAGLKDYQVPAVESLLQALSANGGALDGSDMGVGKTAHACGVIRELNVPTLVAVPAVSVSGWKWMGEHLGVEFDVQSLDLLRGGETPWGWWDNPRPARLPVFYRCESCQCEVNIEKPSPCPHHHSGIHCVKTLKREHKYGKFNWHPNIKLLVVDEVHRCCALDSLQADMLLAAKRQRLPVLGLSATAGDSPLHFRALGYCLGLHSLIDTSTTPGYFRWASRYGVRRIPMRGLLWALGEENKNLAMAKLHREIFPSRGVRVRIKDLGDQFPPCQITAELIDLDAGGRISELYEEMAGPIAALRHRAESDIASPLGELLRLRQEVGLLTMPIFAELAKEAVAAGHHVALFVNFRAEVDALCKLLGTTCRIDGSQTGVAGKRQRDENIATFNDDRSPYIISTAASGGIAISLPDRHGNFPRLGLVSPGYSAREFRQVCGRLPRVDSVTKSIYRVLFAAGTPQEKVHRKLAGKLNNLDTLMDGDLIPFENLRLTEFPECGILV